MCVFFRDGNQNTSLAILAEFNAIDTTDREAGKSQIHADTDAIRIIGQQYQFLCCFEGAACIHKVSDRTCNEGDQEEQQDGGFEFKVVRHYRTQLRVR